MTPCVLGEKRGFSPERGKRPAISFLQQLGRQPVSPADDYLLEGRFAHRTGLELANTYLYPLAAIINLLDDKCEPATAIFEIITKAQGIT